MRYLQACRERERLDALMTAIGCRFADTKQWIVERRLELRKAVGPSHDKDGIHWDAPIVVVIMYRDQEGEPREACGMSLYLEHNALYVQQLQGGKCVVFPRRFKVWPQLFLKSCIAFAQAENFDRVCLAKAETLYTYRWPELGPNGIPRSRESIEDHRNRMKLRYDETARLCGFTSEADWFVWKTAPQKTVQRVERIRSGGVTFPNEEALL